MFSRDEVIVACVVSAFAVDGVPIGRLLRVRPAVLVLLRPREDLERIIKGDEVGLIVIDQKNDSTIWIGRHGLGELFTAYVDEELQGENRKASIIALELCFEGLRADDEQRR